MSSQPANPSGAPATREGKEKHRMSKVLYRVKTVFRKGDSSKRMSAAPLIESAAPAPVVAPVSHAKPSPKPKPEYEGATKIPRSQVHEERAKKLGARFGLEIKPSEWHSAEGDVLRVEKSARMRIHRECHRCNTTFGTSNECPGCQHTRCKKCTRYPLRRTESEKQANREKREAIIQRNKEMAPIIPSYDYSKKGVALTRPSRSGGQDLVYKKVRQRVRRHCHVCDSLISSNTKQTRTCDSCGHKRCDDCPRAPNDRKKYPYGYPNDEPGENFKGVHSCHECKTKFPPNTEHGTECQSCSHPKCESCPRVRPRKLDPEPEPDALEKLQRRWQELSISDS